MNEKKKEKQMLVFNAAIKMFAKYGYRKTTLEDIGDVLGMTKGNLYLYAKNKRDLYESSIAVALKNWQQHAYNAALNENSIVDSVLCYCIKGYEYLKDYTDLQTLIVNDPSIFPLSPADDRFYEINLESMNLLKSLLKTGIEEGVFREIDLDSISELLFSIYVMMIIKTYIKTEDKISEKVLHSGLDLILNGLLK